MKLPAIGVEGMLHKSEGLYEADGFFVKSDVHLGRLVSRDSDGKISEGTSGEVVGVSLFIQRLPMESPVYAVGGIQAKVLRAGQVFVKVLDGCAVGGDVYASDTTGEFRSTAATGFSKRSDMAWESATQAGGLAVLRLIK